MNTIRLDKLLSNLGYCSRKEAAFIIKQGRVALSGNTIEKADHAIMLSDVRNGLLTLDDEAVDPPSPLTIMLNKPTGYSCSHDEKGALVYDLLPARWKMRKPVLSSIGRLDKESTGQLLLTDDGDLLHRVIHPKNHAVKHYEVTLLHTLQGNEAELFANGTFLMQGDNKPLKPAIWQQWDERNGRMMLTEGRYHQIRRMFETLGNKVIGLNRVQTGGLMLGNLEPGKYIVLSETDIGKLFFEQ